MKKSYLHNGFLRCVTVLALVASLCLILASCSGGGSGSSGDGTEENKGTAMQVAEFKGVSIEIPKDWKFNEKASADSYSTYTLTEDGENVVWFQMTWSDQPVELNEHYTLEDAGKTLVDIYKKMSENVKTSDSEQGFFAGEHPMNTVTCEEEVNGVTKYVKYATVYFDDGTLKFTYKNNEEDYTYFNKAIKGAIYEGGSSDTSNGSAKDSDPEPSNSTTIERAGAVITLPGKWKQEKNDSENTRTYKKGNEIFLTYASKVSGKVEGALLGDMSKGFLIGAGYKDLDYYDYEIGSGIPAHIIYVDKEKSLTKMYERYVLFGNGNNFIVFGYAGTEKGFKAIESAMKKVTI